MVFSDYFWKIDGDKAQYQPHVGWYFMFIPLCGTLINTLLIAKYQ